MTMVVPKLMSKCPFCREPIAADATRCKHCHVDLTSLSSKKGGKLSRFNTFRNGFITGVLFTLALLVLAYLHCTSGN